MKKIDLILRKFTLLESFRNINPFTVTFQQPLTVIIGENGSGKSSFFSLITNSIYKNLVKLEHKSDVSYHFFDTEKHNPRIKNNIEHSVNIINNAALCT